MDLRANQRRPQPTSSICAVGEAKGDWLKRVQSMTEIYVGFLRKGVACACGKCLQQPVLESGAAEKGSNDVVDLTAPSGSSSSSSSAGKKAPKQPEILDLTEDDDDMTCVPQETRA